MRVVDAAGPADHFQRHRHHTFDNLTMSETTDGGGFVTSPESSYLPPTPASTATTLASPLTQPPSTRPISSREESRLISNLDDQILTISSRFTRRSLPKLVQF